MSLVAASAPVRSSNHAPRVAIIGAGVAGLCTGIQLKKAGMGDFTIFEKSDGVGGTWRDNSYPGCACDVPSHLYSYSFGINPEWTHKYSPQSEILQYLEHCTDKFDVRSRVKSNTAVASARFDSTSGTWKLKTDKGEDYEAEILVSGVGQLNRP
jgi:cation diffusion facilitator CzcD-associated flavoprotein CzcO